jgi:hypothetical protein
MMSTISVRSSWQFWLPVFVSVHSIDFKDEGRYFPVQWESYLICFCLCPSTMKMTNAIIYTPQSLLFCCWTRLAFHEENTNRVWSYRPILYLMETWIQPALILNRPDDGGSNHLWNVGKLLPDHMAQQPRRQPSSHSRVVYIRTHRRTDRHDGGTFLQLLVTKAQHGKPAMRTAAVVYRKYSMTERYVKKSISMGSAGEAPINLS